MAFKNFATLEAAQTYARRKGIGIMDIRVKRVGNKMVYVILLPAKHINKAW